MQDLSKTEIQAHACMEAKVILKRMALSAGATNKTKESQSTNRVAGKIRPNAREFLRIIFSIIESFSPRPSFNSPTR